MRIIIKFRDLCIYYVGMSEILNHPDNIVLTGHTTILIGGFAICETDSPVIIKKEWLLSTDEVYLDTCIEEAKDYDKTL